MHNQDDPLSSRAPREYEPGSLASRLLAYIEKRYAEAEGGFLPMPTGQILQATATALANPDADVDEIMAQLFEYLIEKNERIAKLATDLAGMKTPPIFIIDPARSAEGNPDAKPK